jgi:uncharacterized protein YlzI (FlbEa/FlbD family)
MKIIAAKIENGVFTPSEELPQGVLTVFNGESYVVYEDGDTLPEQPVYEVVEPTKEDLQAQAQDLMSQLKEVMEKLK